MKAHTSVRQNGHEGMDVIQEGLIIRTKRTDLQNNLRWTSEKSGQLRVAAKQVGTHLDHESSFAHTTVTNYGHSPVIHVQVFFLELCYAAVEALKFQAFKADKGVPRMLKT